MKKLTYIKTVLVLSICGTLFAGYLSALKFLTETCPFNESCPFFLGYPACYYGLVMFFSMFIISFWGILKKIEILKAKFAIKIISFLGILFAGYFTIGEISRYFSPTYQKPTLFLPTCAYGLIFYIAIWVISLIKIK